MPCLTGQQILAADDLPREKVLTPEWGEDGFVFVQTMESGAGDEFDDEIYKLSKDGKSVKFVRGHITARLCARTICDENGKRLFSNKQIDALAKKSTLALNRCYEVSERLNGLGRYREKLEKNFGATAGDDGSLSGQSDTDAQ